MIILLVIAASFIIYFAGVIIYNIAIFLWWVITELFHLCLRIYYKRKENQALKQGII